MAVTFKAVLASGGTKLTIVFTTSDTSLYGQTITISKNGTTVGTTTFDGTGNAEYTVKEAGTYSVVCGAASDTVEVTDEFPVELSAIPDGSTVTPVNDIQTWLNCAGIFNKTSYTTLSEVLADTTTLLALINSQNAVDYMVRSHDWCDDVCADATAMTYIGANNYAADTLLADDNPGLVPTMTSNTTPSGEVIFTSEYNTSGTTYRGYLAFDGITTTSQTATASDYQNSWIPVSDESNSYIGYDFLSAIIAKYAKITLIGWVGQRVLEIGDMVVRGSNDKTTWMPLWSNESQITLGANTVNTLFIDMNNATGCRYYSVLFKPVLTVGGAASIAVNELQFYAKDGSWLESICNSQYFESVLNVKVPTMTDATIPSGEVLASDYASAVYEGYKAFDGKPATIWNSGTTGTTEYGKWIGYHFTSSVCIRKIMIRADSSYYPDLPKTFKGQTSNDGSAWNDVDGAVFTTVNDSTASEQFFAFKNVTNAPYFRIALGYKWRNANYNDYVIAELQFYGRAAS